MTPRSSICRGCPFRRRSEPGHLGDLQDPADFLNRSASGELPFTCIDSRTSICRGSLVFMKNDCKLPRRPDLSSMVQAVEKDEDHVFSNRSEFCGHHLPGCEITVLCHHVSYVQVPAWAAHRFCIISQDDIAHVMKLEVQHAEAVGERDRLAASEARSRSEIDRLTIQLSKTRAKLASTDRRLRHVSTVALSRFRGLEKDDP